MKLSNVCWKHSYLYYNTLSDTETKRIEDNEEVEIIVDKEISDDNQWDADIKFTVFKMKNGDYGYFHLIPAGYSSYTYDPEEYLHVYNMKDKDFEWFKKFALTEDQRGYL